MELQGTAKTVALAIASVAGLAFGGLGLLFVFMGLEGGHTSGGFFFGALLTLPVAAFCVWLIVANVRRSRRPF